MKYVVVALGALLLTGCLAVDRPQKKFMPPSNYCDAKTDIREAFAHLYPDRYTHVVTRSVEKNDFTMKYMHNYLLMDLSNSILAEVVTTTTVTQDNDQIETKTERHIISNLQLINAITEIKSHHRCLIGIALMSASDAKLSLQSKKEIDQREEASWAKIRRSVNTFDYKNHILMFPLGKYREIAAQRMDMIEQAWKRDPSIFRQREDVQFREVFMAQPK